MRQFLRLNLMIFSLSVLLLGLMLPLGDALEGHGTLSFQAGIGSNTYQILVDYDAQMLLMRDYVRPIQRPYAFAAEGELYYFDGVESHRTRLDNGLTLALARWDSQSGKIFLAYGNGVDGFLGTLDLLTGEISPTYRFPDFKLGFGVESPDGRYLMLREEGIIRPVPAPKPMWLFDTLTGEIRDFGSPVFAYWSPDSQYLALGYKESENYESRVERYTIATGERLPYPVLVSQEDTPFFYTNGFSSNGILWSPDSSKMVILNRDTESLNFVSDDGDVLEVTGGRITPLRWSPDGRFLLGIGYANGEIGAFVVDSLTGERNRLQSPVLLQDALSDFAWSPNSLYIAVLTHSSGVLFEQRLVLYDTAGRLVGSPVDLDLTMAFASFDGTLEWVE
jgi:hypothetical protein